MSNLRDRIDRADNTASGKRVEETFNQTEWTSDRRTREFNTFRGISFCEYCGATDHTAEWCPELQVTTGELERELEEEQPPTLAAFGPHSSHSQVTRGRCLGRSQDAATLRQSLRSGVFGKRVLWNPHIVGGFVVLDYEGRKDKTQESQACVKNPQVLPS